jgi:hypothetical protein
MKFFAIKHKLTGHYIRIGRAKRFIWNQFPTNVIRHNIPRERWMEFEIEEFDLESLVPVNSYTVDRILIFPSWNSKQ